MLDWVRLPGGWIQDGGLVDFRWAKETGANYIAALLALVAIAQHTDQETGIAFATYETLTRATGLSRAKLSAGLDILAARQIVSREPDGRSTYGLENYDLGGGWAKLPARKLYADGVLTPFVDFNLRKATELDALKLFLLFVQRRGTDTNMANLGYDKIKDYAGLDGTRIRRALSLLTVSGLVHVERIPSSQNILGIAHGYRIPHLDPYNHMGTRGRALDADVEVPF